MARNPEAVAEEQEDSRKFLKSLIASVMCAVHPELTTREIFIRTEEFATELENKYGLPKPPD